MPLTATLIAFASGLAARVKPISPPSGEVEKNDMKAEIARLKRDLALAAQTNNHLLEGIEMLERELATERSLKAHWRNEARRLAVEARERRERQERHAMQNVALAQLHAQYNALAQAPHQQQALAQQQQALAQQQTFMLGAQNLQLPAHWVCTCIPDRASALRQG